MDEKHICSAPDCRKTGKLISQGVIPAFNEIYRFYACDEHLTPLVSFSGREVPILDYISDEELLSGAKKL